jgi:hypothetical protein
VAISSAANGRSHRGFLDNTFRIGFIHNSVDFSYSSRTRSLRFAETQPKHLGVRGTMAEDHLASFRRLTFNELDQAPDSPGLYAWYGVLRSGRGTWGVDIERGADQGEARSRRALHLHTEHFASAPLAVSVESAFSARWSGGLQDDTFASLRATLENDEEQTQEESDRAAAPKLQNTLHTATMREALFNALEQSAPIFAAPLYIGVAESLHQRLTRHSHNLLVHTRRAAKTSNYFSNVTDAKIRGTFGFRAARQGFSPDNLEVWVLDMAAVTEKGKDVHQLREVAEACEWLLNRWHRPQLGRR